MRLPIVERLHRRRTTAWPARAMRTLVVLMLAAPWACATAPRPRALVLIVIDTLRGDHLGCTGDSAADTPVLDALAREGTLFTEAMTPVPVTLPAVTSLLTGRLPLHHGVRDNDRFVLDEGETTLAQEFQDAGYRTAAVLGSAVLASDRGLARGFTNYDDAFTGPYPVYDPTLAPMTGELGRTRRRADVVTDLALGRIASFDGAPYFLLVHYFDPHMFYDPPPEFRARHPGRPYDAEIAFVDHEIGRLLAGLGDRGDVMVAVVADHGESLGEHGEPQHGFLLYQSTLHVPVIVNGPGVPAGVVRTDPVSLVDLEPTLRGAFRLPEMGRPRDGRQLVWDREEAGAVLYAETFRPLVSYGWSELRAVRSGSLKLIAGPREELYDLERDPGESANLADSDAAARLRVELAGIAENDDPEAVLRASEGKEDPARARLLGSLGYLAGPSGAAKSRPHPLDALPAWLDAQNAKSFAKRAVLEINEDRPDSAVALLDMAVKLDPELADAWYLGGVARLRTGDRPGARRAFERCVAVDPHHVGAASELARMAEENGRFDVAYREWRRVAEVRPDSTSLVYRLALLAERLGRHEEAIEGFRNVIEDAPGSKEAAGAEQALRVIQSR